MNEVIGRNDSYIEDIKFRGFSCAIRRYSNTKEVCTSCEEIAGADDGNAGKIVEAIRILRKLKIQKLEQDSENKCKESGPNGAVCRAAAERHEGERVCIGHNAKHNWSSGDID
jgi:hypothetical protein